MSKISHGYPLSSKKRQLKVLFSKGLIRDADVKRAMMRRIFACLAFFVLMLAVTELMTSPEKKVEARVSAHILSERGALGSAEDELDRIFDEFSSLLPPGIGEEGSETEALGVGAVVDFIKGELSQNGKGIIKTFLLFFGISLLFAVSELVSGDLSDLGATSRSAVSVCMTVPVLRSAWDMISTVTEGLTSGSEFFSGAAPLLCTAAAAGGGVGSAAVSAAGMSVSLSFVSGFLSNNLLPLATLIFSVSLISSFDTGQGIRRVAKGIKNLFSFLIGAVTVVLLGTLSLQNVVAASKDSVALRGVKYAISGMVPVAGGTLSGALSALVSGAGIMTSSMGALSAAAIISFMGAPLISMLLYRLAIEACITFSELVGSGFGQSFFEAYRGALDALIAVLTSSTVIYVMQIVIFTKSVAGLL